MSDNTISGILSKSYRSRKNISSINRGESVKITNAKIKGNLAFIDVEDKKGTNNGIFGDSDTYECHVNVALHFKNCTFKDDVTGYLHEEGIDELCNAMFHEDVVFENCTFNGAALFKYSEFDKKSVF